MNAVMKSFGFGEQLVRIVERDDVPWFVGNDVCAALEIANPRDAFSRLDDDERADVGITDTSSNGVRQSRQITVISESGVYALIFTSRKAVAKTFRKWVTSEVLPALRRDGRYEIAQDESEDTLPATIAPDQFNQQRLSLQKVREARLIFGPAAARRVWEQEELNDVVTGVDRYAAPAMISSQVYRSISEWMDARIEFAPGMRLRSSGLYGDYVRWCLMDGGHEAVSQTAFGRYLSACGIGSVKSDAMYRVGIRIRERACAVEAA